MHIKPQIKNYLKRHRGETNKCFKTYHESIRNTFIKDKKIYTHTKPRIKNYLKRHRGETNKCFKPYHESIRKSLIKDKKIDTHMKPQIKNYLKKCIATKPTNALKHIMKVSETH